MKKVKQMFAGFARNEDGATLVEYGIALGLAITVGTGALATLATDVKGNMTDASTALTSDDATTTTTTGS